MPMPVATHTGLNALRSIQGRIAPRPASRGTLGGKRSTVTRTPYAYKVDNSPIDLSEALGLPAKTPPAAPAPAVVDVPAAAEGVQATATEAAAQVQEPASQITTGLQETATEVAPAASKAAGVGVPNALPIAEDALNSATNALSGASDALSGATSNLTSKVGDVTSSLTSSVTGLTSNLTGTAGEAAGKLSSTVTGLTSSVTGTAGEVAGKVSSTLTNTFSSVSGTLDEATTGVRGSVGSAVEALTSTTQSASQQLQDTLAATTTAVQGVVDSTGQQINSVTTQVTSAVDGTTQQLLGALPPPVKEGALVVGKGLAAVVGQAVQHPVAAGVVTLAVAVPAGLQWYKGRYGGYAGEVSPQLVLDLLSDDSSQAFLVDIRPEEQREEEGVALLKLGARFRVASFPLQSDVVPPKVAREAASLEELKLLINAAYIAGLNPVGGSLTKVVVMDGTGSDKARDLARALVSVGMPLSYVMEGGFKGWVDEELPVSEDSDYDTGAAALLGDNVELLTERASEVVTTVARPQVGVPLVGGSALAAVAAYNYHYTLEYIGVLGVLLTITNKLLQYDNPIEAFKDLGRTVSGAATAVRSFKLPSAPKLPSVPKLPSLPSLPKGSGQKPAAPAAAASSTGSAPLAAAAASSTGSAPLAAAAAGAVPTTSSSSGGGEGEREEGAEKAGSDAAGPGVEQGA